MGAAESISIVGEHRQLLDRFAGSTPVPLDDVFWEKLLSFQTPLTKLKPSEVEELTRTTCSLLAQNNLHTFHLPKLLVHLIRNLDEVGSVIEQLPLKALNTIYFARIFMKHYVEYLSSEEIARHLQLRADSGSSAEGNAQSMLVPLLRCLLTFIGKVDVTKYTYLLHLEAVNLLIVTFSTQLHAGSNSHHLFLEAAMEQKDLAGALVRKLLTIFIEKQPLPAKLPYYVATGASKSSQPAPGVLKRVASSAGTVLFLPYYAFSYLLSTNASNEGPRTPLSDNSLLLLLILVHYGNSSARAGETEPDSSGNENPFKSAMQTCRDTDFDATDPTLSPKGTAGPIIRVPFSRLYDAIGSSLIDDRTTLLLYSLVHGNPVFLEYVLVRTDLDTLLMPLLEMLYTASRRTPNQIYMLLIILLILSQDASFNANVHKILLPGVPWYKERLLPKVSLGSLMVVILIRTVKYNLSKLRDVYLHTNCLATLANMAPHVHQLNAYASQRLVSLFDMLARKYTRLSEAQLLSKNPNGSLSPKKEKQGGPKAGGETGGGETGDDVPTESHIYTDFLRIVLEIINAILTYALPRNPEVVYALLHRQELFQPFRNHPRFYELLENIYTVLDFFNTRMDDSRVSPGEWSVEKVLEVIIANARHWRGEGMKMFTELRFTYEEELHPEEFFIPYVWTLVCAHSNIPWDPACITLFPTQSAEDVHLEDVYDPEAYDGVSEYAATPRASNV